MICPCKNWAGWPFWCPYRNVGFPEHDNLRPSSDAVLHMSQIECKWGRTKDFARLHSIRLMWSTASELQEITTFLTPSPSEDLALSWCWKWLLRLSHFWFVWPPSWFLFSGHWLFPAPWNAFACRTTVSLRQRSFIVQILLHASQGQMLFQMLF